MDIMQLIGLLAPMIVIGLTQILKKLIASRWAPLIVLILGGLATLIKVGPSPGGGFIDATVNVAFVSGGATLIYDLLKKITNKTTTIKILSLLIAFNFLISCAGFESNTYKTMYTLGTAYDTAMKSANELYGQGKLGDEDVQKIIGYANVYYAAYQEAVIAFEIYNKTKSAADKDKLTTALAEVSKKHAEIISYIERFKKQ